MMLNNLVLNLMVVWLAIDGVLLALSMIFDIDWQKQPDLVRDAVTVIILPMIGWMAFIELVSGLLLGGDQDE